MSEAVWSKAQLNQWYVGCTTFDREMYAYFLDIAKAVAGVSSNENSLSAARTAAALTMRNRRIRREKGWIV